MKLFFYAERVIGCAVLLLGCLAPLAPHQKQLNEDSWTLENVHIEGCRLPTDVKGVSYYICANGKTLRIQHPYYLQNCWGIWNGTEMTTHCSQVPLTQQR